MRQSLMVAVGIVLLFAVVACAGYASSKRPVTAALMTACAVTFRCGVCYGVTEAAWTGMPSQEISVKCVHCMTPYRVRIF
jgi:hypothetical protein